MTCFLSIWYFYSPKLEGVSLKAIDELPKVMNLVGLTPDLNTLVCLGGQIL